MQEVVEPSAIVAPEPVEEATAAPSAPVNISGSERKRRRLRTNEPEEVVKPEMFAPIGGYVALTPR